VSGTDSSLASRVLAALRPADLPAPAVDIRGLRTALSQAAAGLQRPQPTADRDQIVLDRYSLPAVLRCPASAAGQNEPFRWSPRFAAHTLGIAALDLAVRVPSTDTVRLVRQVLEERAQDDQNLGGWLRLQGPAELGTTVIQAASWAARAYVAVPWARLGPVRFGVEYWCQDRPGRHNALVLHARMDAEIALADRQPRERVLLVFGRNSEPVSRLNLLATTLKSGRAPLRHVQIDLASGTVTVLDTGEQMLHQGVAETATAARTVVAAARGEELPTGPGPHCIICSLLAGCPAGQHRAGKADGGPGSAMAAGDGLVVSELPAD